MRIPQFSMQRLLMCILFIAAAFGWTCYFGGGMTTPVFLFANVVLGMLYGAAAGSLLGRMRRAVIMGAIGGLAFFTFAVLY